MEEGYLHDYDDPYRMLAMGLISIYNKPTLRRILSDDRFVRKMVADETYEQDARGLYLDCIIEGIISDKRRVEYKHQLAYLANYYFDNLDLERLRRNIREFLDDCGISLDE